MFFERRRNQALLIEAGQEVFMIDVRDLSPSRVRLKVWSSNGVNVRRAEAIEKDVAAALEIADVLTVKSTRKPMYGELEMVEMPMLPLSQVRQAAALLALQDHCSDPIEERKRLAHLVHMLAYHLEAVVVAGLVSPPEMGRANSPYKSLRELEGEIRSGNSEVEPQINNSAMRPPEGACPTTTVSPS